MWVHVLTEICRHVIQQKHMVLVIALPSFLGHNQYVQGVFESSLNRVYTPKVLWPPTDDIDGPPDKTVAQFKGQTCQRFSEV